MSNQLYKSIARYFYRLGLAIVGKDYIYSNVYVALNERVEKAESDLKQLKEMYNAVLGKWSTDASLVKRLAEESTRLHTEVNSYKQLVETLRGSIRDKQSLIDAYVKTERKNEQRMNIGQAIRTLRQKQNMTQGELATRVGMSVNAISLWELGKSNPPKESIKLICDAFHVPVSYFMLSTVEEKDIPENKRMLYIECRKTPR